MEAKRKEKKKKKKGGGLTFVSAWIQSRRVSCVSAPMTTTRAGRRYTSAVNTALPEKAQLEREHLSDANVRPFCN